MENSGEAGVEESALTGKGQTTLPRRVRIALGLNPGDKLRYLLVGGEVRLMKARTIMALEGILHRPGQAPVSTGQMDEDIAAGSAALNV